MDNPFNEIQASSTLFYGFTAKSNGCNSDSSYRINGSTPWSMDGTLNPVLTKNNTTFDSPLYIQGNLCIGNSTAITNELHVWGTAAVTSPASIGQKQGNTITYDTAGVHIKNGCGTSSSGPFTLACGGAQRVWANPFDSSPTTLAAPSVTTSAQGWYRAASPGPYFPCRTPSGTPSNTGNWATAFDGDQGTTPDSSHMNRSVTGAFDLTPSTAYSCKTSWGELSYDPNAKTETVSSFVMS